MSEQSFLAPDPAPTPAPGTPPPAGATIPVAGDPATSPSIPEWLKDVDPEIANDPSLKVFTNHKDLVKSYVHAQKMLGKDKVVLPGKNSTEQDWKQFYNKIGLPESMDAYEIKKGEKYTVHDDALNEFKKLAYENNILPGQAQKVMDWLNERAGQSSQVAQQQSETQLVEGWQNLKKEWGAGFEKQMAFGKQAVAEFADEDTYKYLDQKGYLDDPIFAKMMAKIGSNLTEDVFNEDVRETHGMTPQEAKSKYNEIVGDANHPYRNSSHPNHKQAVADVQKLFEMM